MKKTAIFMTAFNEERNIAGVLEKVPRCYDVYVIDDSSNDSTPSIVEKYGAKSVRHLVNLGQGYAYLTGLQVALHNEYEFVIAMDSDGQHDPHDASRFIKKMEETGCDIVVGSRILGSHDHTTLLRKNFLPYFTWLINKATGYNLTDSMSGFRAFRCYSLRKVMQYFQDVHEPQYLAAEMWIKFSRAGLKIEEIPIHISQRSSGNSYKGEIRYGWRVLMALLKTLITTGVMR